MRRAALVAALALALRADGAGAHGDDDHGVPTQARAERARGAVTIAIETQFSIGLRTQRVARAAIAASIGQAGRVAARPGGDARVGAPVAGRLQPPAGGFPMLGSFVRRGQVLAQIEETLTVPESAQVASARVNVAMARSEARARLSQAQSRLRLAQSNEARVRGLQGVVPAREIAAAHTEIELATAEVDRARRDVSVGGVGGARIMYLRAPIEGTIAVARGTTGSHIEHGDEIFRVVDATRVWIEVRLSESQAASLGPAETAVVTSPNDPGLRLEARRVAVSVLVDEATRTVQAIFEAENPEGRLRIGAAVDVSVRETAPVEMLAVPASAIVEHDGAPSVIVKTGPETFEVRVVRMGPRNATVVGVSSGLRERERVVTEGASTALLAAP